MKFIYFLASALVAAIIQAQPIAEELPPVETLSVPAEVNLHKRDNVEFEVFTSNDCSGGGVDFFASGSHTKGNFGAPQFSARVTKLSPGYHLTMYAGLDQSGPENQFTQNFVGGCFDPNFGDGAGWFSWGLYNS